MSNRILRPVGLELSVISNDFDARLVSSRHLDRMFREIGAVVKQWLDRQEVFELGHQIDPEAEARTFYAEYLQSPFRSPRGGSRFGNLLWLTILSKALKPDLIIDSGTFTGGSAWALSRAAPQANVRSYDLDLSQLLFRAPGVAYVERDWMDDNLTNHSGGVSLIYFDDHVDQGKRLREAAERGATLAVFDDDFSVLNFVSMAHGGAALPKISFILDDMLEDGEVVEWTIGSVRYAWRVNRSALSELRALIAKSERLPDISQLVGIDQLPFRVVALQASAKE